jgi:1,4-alpha-glucan branching enzyme
VTAPVEQGGLGFSYKWNMGWMHDTLRYISNDPVFRRYHHHDMTFGMIYAWSEKFILPISHDEVVHGKGSLFARMPGDMWQKMANLRAYLGFMWAHPGKKLLFMGCEFGQYGEWNHDGSPEWNLLDIPEHRGVQRLVRDLNRLYASEPALHRHDCDPEGFAWIIGDDTDNSVYAFLRKASHDDPSPVMAVINMTPVPREAYRVGAPSDDPQRPAAWRELLNTDAAIYGGVNFGNAGEITSEAIPNHGMPQSIVLTIPPLSVLILKKCSP